MAHEIAILEGNYLPSSDSISCMHDKVLVWSHPRLLVFMSLCDASDPQDAAGAMGLFMTALHTAVIPVMVKSVLLALRK